MRRLLKTQGVWIALIVVTSGFLLFGTPTATGAETTSPELPSVLPSLARVLGALVVVLGLFLAAAWAVRNWRRLSPRAAVGSELRVLEVRSLGVRQSLVVVGYQRQRMLLATSPTGVTLVSHLPEAAVEVTSTALDREAGGWAGSATGAGAPLDFVGAFREVLTRRS